MLTSSPEKEAKLAYGPNGFRILQHGNVVYCAVTGEAIDLEALNYWSVEYQEPYANADAAAKRLAPPHSK